MTTMQHTFHGYLAALAATFLWAGNYVVARGVADSIAPVQLNVWRWVVALLCMLVLALPKLKEDWPGIRRSFAYLSFMGFVGVTCMNALIYKAGQTTESLNMALIVPTAPVIILVLSRICYGEPITARRMVGFAVVFAGVLMLIGRGSLDNILAVRFKVGDFWALAGAACFGVYSLFVRSRPATISMPGFNAATFALGIVFSLPVLLWEVLTQPATVWTAPVIGSVLYIGIGCSFLAYLCWIYSIGTIGPVSCGMVYYTLPLFAAVEGLYILGEPITDIHIMGGGLIVAGIITATLPARALHPTAKSL